MEYKDRQYQESSEAHQQGKLSHSLSNGHVPDSPVPSVLTYLGLSKSPSALDTQEHLLAELRSPQWSNRVAAVCKLLQYPQTNRRNGALPPAVPPTRDKYSMESPKGLMNYVLGEQESIQALLMALQDEHRAVRAAAVRALGLLGERVPLDPLLAALQDAAWHVRTEAVLALGKQCRRAPVEPLVASLSDEDGSVRAAAAWAVGELGERAPIAPLVAALRDPDWSVREAAAHALGELGGRTPLEPLLLARTDEDSAVREAAEQALQQLRFASSAEPAMITEPYSFDWHAVFNGHGQRSISGDEDSTLDQGEPLTQGANRRFPFQPNQDQSEEVLEPSLSTPLLLASTAERPHAKKPTTSKRRLDIRKEPGRGKRYRQIRIAEGVLVAAVIAGIVLSWMMVNQRFHTTTGAYFSYRSHTGAISSVVWSSPHDTISGGTTLIAFAGADGWVQVWDTAARQLMASYGPFNKVQALSWAAAGLHVAYMTNDHRIQLSLLMEGVQYPTMSLESPSGAAPLVTWSPEGKRVAVAFNTGKDGTVEVWDTATRKPVTKHPGRFGAVTSMAWTGDGTTIATANDNGKDRTIEVWDTTTGQSTISSVVEPYIFAGFRVVAMAWSPDGTRLAYVFDNGEVRIWSRKTDTDIGFSTDISSSSNQHLKAALAWSPDGQQLAFTTASGLIQVRDANSGSQLYSYSGHTKPVNDMAWTSNGKSIASASADGTVQVWGPA